MKLSDFMEYNGRPENFQVYEDLLKKKSRLQTRVRNLLDEIQWKYEAITLSGWEKDDERFKRLVKEHDDLKIKRDKELERLNIVIKQINEIKGEIN